MHFFRAILIGLLALIATGCGKGGVQSPDFTPVLQNLTVTPATATVAAGLTQQFTVVGVYSVPPGSDADSDPRPIENVEWSSSDTSRATIDADGLVTAISAGPVTITASADGVEGTALLTVGAPQLQSLTITPATSTVAVDSSTQLTATGAFSDGSTQPVSATWSSGNTTFVTVTAGPATTTSATGVSVGTATITATADGGLTATATVAVRARVVSITIVPDTGTSPAGRPFQYSATGTIKTGPTTNSTGNTTDGSLSGVVWSIANAVGDTNPAQVANIDSTLGIATGLRVGNAVVTAAVDTATDTAAFVVTPAVLDRISITPANPSLALGATAPLTANGVFTDGRLQQVSVTWSLQSSSVPGIVTFDPNPAPVTQVTAAVVGTGTILATAVSDPSITGTTGVTVTNAVLQAIVGINPPLASVNPGRSIEFHLQGRFSDNVVRDIDDSTVTWTSGTPAVATIDADGIATGVSEGQTVITATTTAITPGTATATLTVTNSQCTTPLLATNGVQVTPLASGLCLGCSVLNSAGIIDASDTTFGTLFAPVGVSNQATISALVTNGANTPDFAGGNNAGFLIGAPVGVLGASVAQRVQVATLFNGAVRETSGDLIPLRVEALGQLILPGGVPSENYLVSIRTSLPYDGIMITSVSGVAQVLSDVQVFQACGTVTPAVQPALVALSRIEPIAPTIVAGQARNLVAYGTLSNGTEVEIADADLNWTSNNVSAATVDANGLVTAVAPGLATVTATLKSTVTATGARSAVSNVTVISGVCTTPFLVSPTPLTVPGSTASGAPFGICLFCNVANPTNAIDGQLLSGATVSVPVALLSPIIPSGASLSVLGPVGTTIQPPAGGQFTGFVIGRPLNPLLQAELLDSIQVSTLRRTPAGPVVVETVTSGPQSPLRLGLLGLGLVDENELVLAGIRATQPYDGIRVTFNAGLATALSNFLVYESCAAAVEPTVGDQ
ncbi:uncharacterized protein YjdB [Panacagrimonas perspica]|uniref:Uncharacterized protein YjdB n=1 Tax=Panacagrimonas perspica TaxID=381431 RepID=A0A4S3KAU0_9GAMM|nr:Ig-like domain-containing protein [Panacagrimonas perspica]TDU32555.1 uncharacterized protein YjdB [Panacagrimonas perspica]THD05456.1 hypothetical protein B1810_01645 [Panacagrimonas perspica]